MMEDTPTTGSGSTTCLKTPVRVDAGQRPASAIALGSQTPSAAEE
jgi:hypothetical protein